jgi:hypothetical protein
MIVEKIEPTQEAKYFFFFFAKVATQRKEHVQTPVFT